MAGDHQDDSLAYGDYYEGGRGAQGNDGAQNYQEGERGLIGDTFRKLHSFYKPQQQDQNASPPLHGSAPNAPPYSSGQQPSSTAGSSLFDKFHGAVHGLGSELNQRLSGRYNATSPSSGLGGSSGTADASQHRYGSFAATKFGNDAKWYVDGCTYMWAVSRALEQARESIWILDWWLSPELYLRRPPSRHEPYRLDRMLQAAAQRGVKVNIIVYKEVTQALTLCSSHTKHALENLHPNIAVFRHPDHLPDAQTLHSSFISSLQNFSLTAKAASQLPGDALKAIYGINEGVILYWAHHEKLCLIDGKIAFMGGLDLCYGRWDSNDHPIADCHPSNLENSVFPGQDFNNARIMDFQDVSHWEQNKLERSKSARMGWSDISISLSGPVVEDLQRHFVERWNFIYNEKYNVRKDVRYSRLKFNEQEIGANPNQGPSAVPPNSNGQLPISAESPYQPYSQPSTQASQSPYYPPPPGPGEPQPSAFPGPPGSAQGQSQYHPPPPASNQVQGNYYPPPPPPIGNHGQYPYSPQPPRPTSSHGAQYFPPPPGPNLSRSIDDRFEDENARGFGLSSSPSEGHHHLHERLDPLRDRLESGMQHLENRHGQHHFHQEGVPQGGVKCQIVRSCTKWSHGVPTQHSIADAYISIIQNSQYFVYIENQFFITATTDAQKPIKNKIGAAIVERILRAARAGEKYKVIVIMPAVPAFAGDLKDDASLGTRAIMEFQYDSINRGGHSIMESIATAGYDPTEYIRFYNLRNYDRINASAALSEAEQMSGIGYEEARKEHDQVAELPTQYAAHGDSRPGSFHNYRQYQQGAAGTADRQGLGTGRWDSVSECYMLGGTDIRQVPWENGNISEMNAFVSEELYVHSKVLIADDRIVICGSANLNDRSQLGDHDSEIAIIIEDPTPCESIMNGRPHRAAKFAATLRRQLFRKHLGLIPKQNMESPDLNFEPVGVPNAYDYGSPEDLLVVDPLADQFLALWNSRARQNTFAFGKIFHPVPHDDVRTWNDYDVFYEAFFHEEKEKGPDGKEKVKKAAKYQWGHVVAENFSSGAQGVVEMKELLSTIRGTLVEMPLLFLIKEDIAKEGVGLNAFTEDVYT